MFQQEFWVGLAIYQTSEKHVKIGIAIHDGTYSVDFAVHQICPHTKLSEEEQGQAIESHILSSLAKYRREHACKLLGTGVTADLDSTAPYLCSRLWSELDIVPVVFKITAILGEDAPAENVDELADSMARKCLA